MLGFGSYNKAIKNRMYRFLCVLLFIGAFIRPTMLVYERRETFLSGGFMAQFSSYQKSYYSSQYMNKINPGSIPDETFESFAGGAFLKGTNPILIVHEHPPMGRYIIALSIWLFDNPRTIIVPLMIFSFIGLFLISKTILKSTLLAFFPLIIFANDPLVMSKFEFAPLLEPIQLPFIIFALYFFIKGVYGKKYLYWFIAVSNMLGFVISIRFFVLGAAMIFGMMLYFFVTRTFGKKFITFILTLPLCVVVLLFSYTKTIIDGYSIIKTLGIQKYILFYHKSQLINPFSFWDLILFNRWHTWWGDMRIISDSTWHIGWPISIVSTVCFLLFIIRKKLVLSKAEIVIFLWVFSYILLLSGGMATTRYFLPLLPFLYILSFDFVVHIWKTFYEKKI